jgi:hypothetical protein
MISHASLDFVFEVCGFEEVTVSL